MWKLLVVVLIGCYLSKYMSYKDVFVLISGNENINVDILKMFSQTKLLYKVKNHHAMLWSNISSDSNRWNYAILASDFADDISIKNYVMTLQHFDFIEDVKEVNLVANYGFVRHSYNIFWKVWSYVGSTLGFIPARPFKRSLNPTTSCLPQDENSEDKIQVISLLRVVNQQEMNIYMRFLIWKGFPALTQGLQYIGKPVSDYWTSFAITRYKHFKDYCELSASEIFDKYVKYKVKSVEDSYRYVVELI